MSKLIFYHGKWPLHEISTMDIRLQPRVNMSRYISRELLSYRRDFLSLLWSSMFSVTYRTRNTTFDNCIWLHVNEDKGRSFVVRYLLRDFTPFAHPVVIRWSAPCKVEWRCFRVTLALLVWLFCNGKLIISACDCIVGYSININIINGHNELYFWCNRLFCC